MTASIRPRFVWPVVLGLVAALSAGITAAPAAADTTFVVDNTSDDAALSDCTPAPGDCSLRGAVAAANANPGADSIEFSIPATQCPGGVCPITLIEGPITISEPVVLDATTQPQNGGPQANVCATATEPSHMRVLLTSDATGGDYDILEMTYTGDGSTIRGFAFATAATSPSGIAAIYVSGGNGHHIACNHIGVNAAGTANTSEYLSSGVLIESSATGVIVGTNGDGIDDLGERNVFGEAGSGSVFISGNDDNWIAGNYFGFTADGTGTITSPAGVNIRQSSSNNLVGTNGDGISDEIERNFFAGTYGVFIDYWVFAGADNWIVGNTFGMTPSGDQAPTDTGIDVRTIAAVNTGTEIRDNFFAATETGIAVVGGDSGTELLIADNTFGGTDDGVPFGTLGSIILRGAGSHVIRDNLISNSFAWAISLSDAASVTSTSEDNCFIGNVDTVRNNTGVVVDFENNWWGSADGPSGNGPGGGDPVGDDVDFSPWLGSPPLACNPPPVATGGSYIVNEDIAVGSILGRVTVVDDGTTLTYVIVDGDPNGAFAIDAVTGVITIAAALDFEATPTYSLTVEVSDGLSTDTAAVDVEVRNVAPIVSDASFTVAEDAAVGTAVGTVVADDGVATLGFTITGGDGSGVFSIDPDTGLVTTAALLDYEAKTSYSLLVTVDDSQLSDTSTVTVNVTDVDEGQTFIDVPNTHTFHDDIEWLASSGITRGCNPPANDRFCPDDGVTRSQMAAFLHRALGATLTPGEQVTFTDIAGSVFATDIEWLGGVGVTRGCNPPVNDMFCPVDQVTRGQMAAFLVRAFDLPDATILGFVDDDGSIFEEDIERLAAAGITRGCNPPSNTMFCPNDPVTRAQMAAFLRRAME